MSDPLLSIVTGTLNRPRELERLLDSVADNTICKWEMLVADASEGACEKDYFIERGLVKIRSESPRLGHVRGYNRLFSACTGEYVMWLNDDAEVLTGYDTAAINFMEANKSSIGLGAFYYSEPPRQPRFHVNFCYGMLFANFGIIQRSFGDSIGWFDEDFAMYGSDNSITFRTLLAGRGVGTIPGKFIIHHATQDDVRASNQIHRKPASELLRKKYFPLVPKMKDVYSRTANLVGPRIYVG